MVGGCMRGGVGVVGGMYEGEGLVWWGGCMRGRGWCGGGMYEGEGLVWWGNV